MKLCKLIDAATIIVQDNPLFLPDGTVLSNPTDKMLKELGFKELITTEAPKATFGKKMVPNYYESGRVIRQIWVEDTTVQNE